VAVRSKAWVWGRSLAGIAGLNPAEGMSISCECCVLSGRGLCDGPIPLPEVSECDIETSTMRRPRLTRTVQTRKKVGNGNSRKEFFH